MDNSLYELAHSAGSLRDGRTFEDWFTFQGGEAWLNKNRDRGADKEVLAMAFRIGRAEHDLLAGQLPRTTPPVEYRALVDALGGEAQAAEKTLDYIIFEAVRLRNYIEGRLRHGNTDKGHQRAVEFSNRELRKVRTLMGYHTTTELSY